jgi:anaerobic magnesium-protoporphyrin IX monomethyl ester cyclase
MKIALLTPPVAADSIHPYSALPVLTGYLRHHGFEDVVQRDLSIEAFDYLLTPANLQRSMDRAFCNFGALNARPTLEGQDQISYRMIGNALRNSRTIMGDIERARAILKSPEFFDPKRMFWARRIVGWAHNLISSAYYPTIVGSGTFSMPGRALSRSWELRAGVEDDEANPFSGYYDHVVLDWLADYGPELIGLSITYQSQFIPALSLARAIKKAGFKSHVTIGGGFVSWMAHHEPAADLMLEYADSFVVNEGEVALTQMAHKLSAGTDLAGLLASVDNIAVRLEGKTHRAPAKMVDIDSVPTPDFGDLFSGGSYDAPNSIYLYQSSRGCYAGCAFCCVSKHQKDYGYRRRNLDLIIDDIKTLAEHNQVHRPGSDFYLFIADDTHSPPHLRALSRRLLDEKIEVKWMCEARLDKGFDKALCQQIYDAGCRHIFFGMESANERVLKTMMKGTHLKYMSEALTNIGEAGLGTYISLVIGFPTETALEAQDTLDFIRQHEKYIFTVGFNPFVLARGSYVHMYPGEFGVTLKPDNDSDIQVTFDYDVATGMNRQEARELALKAQSDWFENRTRPRDFSLSLFDGYTLLYLSRYNLRFVDDLFADVDPLGADNTAKRENMRYIPDSVWSNIGRAQLAHA